MPPAHRARVVFGARALMPVQAPATTDVLDPVLCADEAVHAALGENVSHESCTAAS